MKSFTSLEQSKKLAEILPLKSADMAYIASATDDDGETLYTAEYKSEIIIHETDDCINCWSLAALLEVLHDKIHLDNETYYLNFNKVEVKYLGYMTWDGQKCISSKANTIVDACYEMIIKLNELKML